MSRRLWRSVRSSPSRIVFLFLHNLRGTLIVALAIPTSIIATFLVLYSLGFTLNTMTLMGLSLAVGILVDDSIVVLENIYRHLQMGETPQEAAINGRGEIGLAAVTITLVDVVVFLPVAFMGGIVGQFFRSFGITVATATLFSLLMSFTLAPMLAARWYKKGRKPGSDRRRVRRDQPFAGMAESLVSACAGLGAEAPWDGHLHRQYGAGAGYPVDGERGRRRGRGDSNRREVQRLRNGLRRFMFGDLIRNRMAEPPRAVD